MVFQCQEFLWMTLHLVKTVKNIVSSPFQAVELNLESHRLRNLLFWDPDANFESN